MDDLQEFERRISQALDRIGAGIEALDGLVVAHPSDEPAEAAHDPEKAQLAEALAAERDASAQLTERVRMLHEKQAATVAPLEAQVAELTRQVDAQALELQGLKSLNIQLRESLRAARDEAGGQGADAELKAELAALRAARAAEIAELDSIMAELKPLIAEAADA